MKVDNPTSPAAMRSRSSPCIARRIVRCLAVLTLALSGGAAMAQIRFVVAYEDNAQPPYYLEKSTRVPPRNPGVSIEMMRLLEQRIPDLRLSLVRYPWKRCLDQLEHGQVDAVFNASYMSEREHHGAYPMKAGRADNARRLTSISYALYTLKDAPVRWDGSHFSHPDGTRFGAPLGFSIVEDLRGMGETVTEAPNAFTVLQQLKLGRVDAAVVQSASADIFLAANPALFDGIMKHEPPVATKAYFLMLSHQFQQKNPQLAERIWSEIGRLRESELPRLLSRYTATP